MSELSIQTWTMPAAALGPQNPLPPLFHRKKPQFEGVSQIPDEVLENMSYGHVSSILPYTLQDGYSRELQFREFQVAVLENDILRAAFLLEYGGRLWSLFHKPSEKELLEVNPVFQHANLALRNAWFSGGMEFNIATTGHSPLTCSPVYAARLKRTDGSPILRLYEWERLRQAPFQIDISLPVGSPLLFLRVRIINPNKHTVPMYWWSNIAVPQRTRTRVIAPAREAFCVGCQENAFARVPVPKLEGVDITYPSTATQAADIFFNIPADRRPWITALDEEGEGLVHVSTHRLRGRKLWVWGRGTGGENWQKFLSPPGEGYIEIQAGLTSTQFEHVPMPPGADWSWVEALGFLQADPKAIHGPDWDEAIRNADEEIERFSPYTDLLREYEQGAEIANSVPHEVLQQGSGWGALERRRREFRGEAPLPVSGMIFNNDSLDKDQAHWIFLIEEGSFPYIATQAPPRSYMIGDKWLSLMESAVKSTSKDNWFALLHLGVARYAAGDLAGARSAWERSIEIEPNPWSTRNLAILFWEQGQLARASALLVKAFHMAPDLLPLAIETGRCLMEAGQASAWLDLLEELPDDLRSNGRIRMLQAQAALAENELAIVARFFDERVIPEDLREGEDTLTDLWYEYQAKRLSMEENLPLTIELRVRAAELHPLPQSLNFSIDPRTVAAIESPLQGED